jgi:antitoxin FitA
MPITLSIRNVPDDVAERLRARAKRNHRSVQGELMALVSEASNEAGLQDEAREFVSQVSKPKMSVREVADEIRKLGLPRPAENESTKMIRDDRDEFSDRHLLADPKQKVSPAEALRQMRALGVRTKDEVVQMIREDRDR